MPAEKDLVRQELQIALMSAVPVLGSSFDSRGAVSLPPVIALLLLFDARPSVGALTSSWALGCGCCRARFPGSGTTVREEICPKQSAPKHQGNTAHAERGMGLCTFGLTPGNAVVLIAFEGSTFATPPFGVNLMNLCC